MVNFFDKMKEKGYRWNFLLNWSKEDDPEYYKELFKVKVLDYIDKKKNLNLPL